MSWFFGSLPMMLAPTSGVSYAQKALEVQSGNLIGFFALDEESGTVAIDQSPLGLDGAYIGGPTLGENGLQGEKCVRLIPPDYINIHHATRAADFDENAGTFGAWLRVINQGVWTDSTKRTIFSARNGSGRLIDIFKSADANTLGFNYNYTGGNLTITAEVDPMVDFFHVAGTWSRIGNAFEWSIWVNGEEAVSDSFGSTATWGDDPSSMRIGQIIIDSAGTWDGYVQWSSLWNTVLSDNEMAQIGTL